MDEDGFEVRFWGTRGSLPVSGPQFVRHGGNTACVEMRCGAHTLMFDAGSGIMPAGLSLLERGVTDIQLFLTHSHFDHIIGLPFFKPLYYPDKRVALWSGHLAGIMKTRELVSEFMRPPWFPVPFSICRADVISRDFVPGDVLTPLKGISVRTGSLNHPGGCVGYRVEWGGRAVALISDTEHIPGTLDPAVLELIRDADLFIYDCTYTEEEMPLRRGFGHSTWEQGVKLAKAAGVQRLALFHHDPTRTDAALATMERRARKQFPEAFAARDGLTLEITTSAAATAGLGSRAP